MPLDPPVVSMETQSAFMAAAASTVIWVAVLFQRRDRNALLFAVLTLAFALFSLGRGVHGLAQPWGLALAGVGLALLWPLAPTVAASLTCRSTLVRRLLPLTLLGPPVFVAALLVSGPERLVPRIGVGIWALFGVAWSALLLMRFRPDPREDPTPDSTRLRYLTIAHGIVVGAAVLDTLMWKLGGPRVASLLTPLLYLYAGYLHLARVRVADLRQLMGNTVALTLMALGLVSSFVAIRIWVGTRLDLFVFNSFVASFVLLLFYPPVRSRAHHLMDRYFVASKLELERTLSGLRERLAHILTLDDLIKDLVATLERTHRVRSSSIFLRDAPHLGFQQAGSIGLPTRSRINLIRDPVWIEALEADEVLLYEELDKSLAQARAPEEQKRLERLRRIMRNLDAQVVLRLRAEHGIVGFWTLSEANPREPFSTTEVRLLHSVADQIAVSIENSKTFERIRARDRLANLGEMAAGLAHEIRNPLATIRGALAVLSDTEAPADAELDGVIVEEIERLDRVVATFLDYARPWTRQGRLGDLEDFVRTCADAVARHHADEEVEVRFESKGEIPPITADPDQLERVVTNLVENAYEVLEGKGMIRITVNATGAESEIANSVEISVEDNGPGMDEATLERVFIPFFTTKHSGTGLGLPLCEKFMRSQGGTIDISSTPGTGTLVRVRLPCAPPSASEDGEGA